MAVDTVLRGGRIVDGTGAPWFRGAVAIDDGTIAGVYRTRGAIPDAETVVDVDGDVICPGFIDTHSHSDLVAFEDGPLAAKVRQGITTEVLGQDGFSMAPLSREGGAETLRRHLSALAGDVDREWTWQRLPEYFEALESSGIGPNLVTLVGHGTVRFDVMGMDDREPTAAELDEMCSLVDDALEAGAVGLSTGLIYTPCNYADTEELAALAERLEPYGRPFVAHVRSEGRWLWDALDEFIDIGADVDVPLHLSHFKVAGAEQHGKANRAIEALEIARERGVDITAEQYPYTASSTMLSATLPPWLFAEGPETAIEHLRDEDTRERIRKEIAEWRIDGWENPGALAGWENVVVTNVNTDANEALEGKTIEEIAAQRDTDPVGAVCDLLVEEELGVSMLFYQLAERDVQEILTYERVAVATDGLFGGTPHPRVYGTYPRVLGHYVREENLLSLEAAVRKMTSLPARILGLDAKGLLRSGMDADLVVFDPKIVESRATYETPRQHPRGIDHVLVNGEFAVRNGETTGKTPGKAVRA